MTRSPPCPRGPEAREPNARSRPDNPGPTTQGPPAMPSIQVPGPSSELQERWPGLFEPPRAPLAARVARAIMRSTGERLPVQVRLADGKVIGAGGPESPQMCIHRPDAFFHRVGADLRDRVRRGVHGGRLGAAGPGTDLADLLTPFAERSWRPWFPVPLQRLRRLIDKRMPVAEVNTHDGARAEHRGALRPVQRAVRDVPRRDDVLLVGLVRRGDRLTRPTWHRRRSCARSTASSTTPASGTGPGVLEIGTGWGALAIRAARARRDGHHRHALGGAGRARAASGSRRPGVRRPGRGAAARLPRRSTASTTPWSASR